MLVRPTVVSVTVVDELGAVFVTEEAPATVKESAIAVPVTFSLNVRTMVLRAVRAAVNVGAEADTCSGALRNETLRATNAAMIMNTIEPLFDRENLRIP